MDLEKIQFPEKINFKKVFPEDWKKLRDIRLKGLETDPDAFGGNLESESNENESYWKERLADANRTYYATEKENVFVSTANTKKTGDNWLILGVYTLKEFEGKGFAKELINKIVTEAKNAGVDKVSLFVNIENERAVNFYKKMDFKIIEEKTEKDTKMGDGKSHNLYYMEKNISNEL